jgi:hypothetical protein
MIQRIPNISGKLCTALWDTGAQISLVMHQYARKQGFKGRPASIQISGVVFENKKKSKVQYKVLLRKIDGSLKEFRPHGFDKITGGVIDLSKARNTFSAVAQDLESPGGPIHLLIGTDHIDNAPKEQEREEKPCLAQICFKDGLHGVWKLEQH